MSGAPLLALVMLLAVAACSPEADRVRDGGNGADPGNKDLVESPPVDPQTRDTTLWPGRAPAPVERLARGEIPPPAGVSPAAAPGARDNAAITSDVPASRAEERTFDKGTSGDARSQQNTPPPKAGRPPPDEPAELHRTLDSAAPRPLPHETR